MYNENKGANLLAPLSGYLISVAALFPP